MIYNLIKYLFIASKPEENENLNELFIELKLNEKKYKIFGFKWKFDFDNIFKNEFGNYKIFEKLIKLQIKLKQSIRKRFFTDSLENNQKKDLTDKILHFFEKDQINIEKLIEKMDFVLENNPNALGYLEKLLNISIKNEEKLEAKDFFLKQLKNEYSEYLFNCLFTEEYNFEFFNEIVNILHIYINKCNITSPENSFLTIIIILNLLQIGIKLKIFINNNKTNEILLKDLHFLYENVLTIFHENNIQNKLKSHLIHKTFKIYLKILAKINIIKYISNKFDIEFYKQFLIDYLNSTIITEEEINYVLIIIKNLDEITSKEYFLESFLNYEKINNLEIQIIKKLNYYKIFFIELENEENDCKTYNKLLIDFNIFQKLFEFFCKIISFDKNELDYNFKTKKKIMSIFQYVLFKDINIFIEKDKYQKEFIVKLFNLILGKEFCFIVKNKFENEILKLHILNILIKTVNDKNNNNNCNYIENSQNLFYFSLIAYDENINVRRALLYLIFKMTPFKKNKSTNQIFMALIFLFQLDENINLCQIAEKQIDKLFITIKKRNLTIFNFRNLLDKVFLYTFIIIFIIINHPLYFGKEKKQIKNTIKCLRGLVDKIVFHFGKNKEFFIKTISILKKCQPIIFNENNFKMKFCNLNNKGPKINDKLQVFFNLEKNVNRFINDNEININNEYIQLIKLFEEIIIQKIGEKYLTFMLPNEFEKLIPIEFFKMKNEENLIDLLRLNKNQDSSNLNENISNFMSNNEFSNTIQVFYIFY